MNQLRSKFYDKFDASNVLTEYPRPNLVRDSYINLNGYWNYLISKSKEIPLEYEGKILVPFCIESNLSEVGKKLMPNEYLWYQRNIMVQKKSGYRTILHFGAVDQVATVYINNKEVFHHVGGYLPFHVDITDELDKKMVSNSMNEVAMEVSLILRVVDVTDSSYHSRGKQKLEASGMFYTPCSGIWQTVWMEYVPDIYIEKINITPNLDEKSIYLNLNIRNWSGEVIHIEIKDKNQMDIYKGSVKEKAVRIPISRIYPWSPEEPDLYSIKIQTEQDFVQSYFAMRKFSIDLDEKNVKRIFLNNKPYFQHGLLDQGYWPESLYTAPTDEALAYDVKVAKEMGFNMLRKHAKIEPLRWYFHCDRLGVIVWQDMVNGGSSYNSNLVTIFPNLFPLLARRIKDNQSYHLLSRKEVEGRDEFIQELENTIDTLYHFPSIAVWVPFNEGWGQFDSNDIVDKIRSLDGTRLVDQASGWFDQGGGDFKSHHVYFSKIKFKKDIRAVVLSEYGGFIHYIKGHSYSNKVFGYRIYKKKESFYKAIYHLYINRILREKKKYLSAAVYTQITDVEEEVNGLLTYDRKVMKIPVKDLYNINAKVLEE